MILVLIIAVPSAFVAWHYLTLRSYQLYIQQHYAAEIELLTTAMHEWPEDRFADEPTYRRIESLNDELITTFNAGDFYCASWSFDSHHGLKGTGLPDSGFSTYAWLSTSDSERQSLRYGKTFGGKPLLIYQRWLKDAPVMKHIEIVLYRDKVDRSRASQPGS